MSLDDTLELDEIIQEWSRNNSNLNLNGDESSFDISGIQTKTSILNPKETGDYTITINGQELSVKVTSPSTIPDSVVTRYNPDSLNLSDGDSVSTLTDSVSNNDLTGTGPIYRESVVNGRPVVRFDGTDDSLSGSFSTTIPQPYTVMLVQQCPPNSYDWTWESKDGSNGLQVRTDGSYRLDGSNNLDTASYNNGNFAVITVVYDGGDTQIRHNGSAGTSGTAKSQTLSSMVMGNSDYGSAYADVDYGEFVIYDQDLRGTQTLTDEEQRLADKYGVALS